MTVIKEVYIDGVKPGDKVLSTDGSGYAWTFRVEREEPTYKAGTMVKYQEIVLLRLGLENHWIRTSDGGVTGWDDEAVTGALRDKILTPLFTPDVDVTK